MSSHQSLFLNYPIFQQGIFTWGSINYNMQKCIKMEILHAIFGYFLTPVHLHLVLEFCNFWVK